MSGRFARTELLLGDKAMERLGASRVAVFGLGGVGGYAAEALVRTGVGAIDLVDNDKVAITNFNRQIYATEGNTGRYKTDVARERILDINPDTRVTVHNVFYMPDTAGQFDFSMYDYIVDAIDTVTGKIELAMQADRAGTPVISSMGTGNKLDPTAFKVADIYDTSVCPLARVMRRELARRGIKRLKVVYSEEKPLTPIAATHLSPDQDLAPGLPGSVRRQAPGSVAFVPPVAGLIIAGEVIKDLISQPG